MEKYLEKIEPIPHFPGINYYKHKLDGFIYTDLIGGPEFWTKHGNNFEARETDVYITCSLRSGTTWTGEIVYLILNDLDYEKAKEQVSMVRAPFLNFDWTPTTAFDIPSPRCIKTHLPYTHLPKCIKDKKCKIIHAYRNPKDSIVSYYNFGSMNKNLNFVGDFNDMFDLFMQDKWVCGPFWKNFLSYWEHRSESNFLFTSYEERKMDTIGNLKQICSFLGKEFTDEQLKGLAEYTSFNSMKSNPAVNLSYMKHFDRKKSDFMRKGEVGDWKNYMTPEQSEQIDEYVRKYFDGTGVKFDYEI